MTIIERPYGGLTVKHICDAPDDAVHLIVVLADPIILIDDMILARIELCQDDWYGTVTLEDGVLTVRANNRTVVYRIEEPHPWLPCHYAQRPD